MPAVVECRALSCSLPTLDELVPFGVFLQMSPENIVSIDRGFLRGMQQGHLDFTQFPSALAMVAGGAGGHYVRPDMFTAQVLGPDMVNGQVAGMSSAVLAGVFVTAKNLAAG